MIKTGIFGGSFNPIHKGHIALAQQLRKRAGLDEVWLMVSPQNPLKQSADLLDDKLRMEMARRALVGVEGIVASDYEMHLPKPSYTWNTLQALSKDYPDREFVLLMGGDNWERFDQWYRHEDIAANYQIVVYPRKEESGKRRSSFARLLPQGRKKENTPAPTENTRCCVLDLPLLDISSTEIRERIRAGKGIRRLVPAVVADFIKEKGLYK
jgi:nicotinate-nucleotide adenylyltransferase